MTVPKMKELAKTKGYYRISYKGNFWGITSGKLIGIVLKRGKYFKEHIADLSYSEVSFMEYITYNQGYGLAK